MKKSLLTLAFALIALSPAELVPAPSPPRTISFSGYTWLVKSSTGRVGPGPNYFSNSPQNVWVDAQGRLHLMITNAKGKWYCAEIISQLSFGHGTYRFYLDSAVDVLDKSVVLGLFTWNDDPAFDHRELDIEFSRWGSANNQNAQYVVQPYTLPQNILRFDQPPSVQSTHIFLWMPNQVFFQSVKGTNAVPAPSDIIKEWSFTGSVPPAGGENARMNLWLFRGSRPSDGKQVEVVISRFEFVPAP
jgi:hypothetical protein